MEFRRALWGATLVAFFNIHAPAATLYVDLNSTNPVPPYADWSTAATNIQDAVNASANGDLILVTNGVYQTGGRTVNGFFLTNRVAVTKPVTLQSVNGPAATIIQGYQVPGTINGSNAVRCVFLTSGAVLAGFTLTSGATLASGDPVGELSGGGVSCESASAIVTNCVLSGNEAYSYGGGAFLGTLDNCLISGNSAPMGAGASSNTLNNCLLENNSGSTGSGAYGCVLANCNVVSNAAFAGGGAAFSTLLNCTLGWNHGNNLGGGVTLCTLSNCLLTGNSNDGAYRSILDDCTISNNISTTGAGGADQSTLNNCLLCDNQGNEGGGAYDSVLNFCIVSNNLANFGSGGGGVYYDYHQTSALGQNNIVFGNMANGAGGGVYLGINANLTGWTVISNLAVSNGGGLLSTSSGSTLSNCTFLGNSSGGSGGGCYGPYPYLVPATNCTFIGNVAAGNGGGACYAALTNCSVIANKAGNGGGIYGTANNCIVNDNVATNDGGGLYYYYASAPYPPIVNCAFTNNSASNGGGASDFSFPASALAFSNCVFWANAATNSGGGMQLGGQLLAYCTIVSNHANVNGGGVASGFSDESTLSYCVVSHNTAGNGGGGVYDCSIVNCLLSGNSATYGGGTFNDNMAFTAQGSTVAANSAADAGGGFYWTQRPDPFLPLTNCIIYDNSASANMNYSPTNALIAYYCCTTPLPFTFNHQNGNNITNDPVFANAAADDFRLQSNSPCINSGNNAIVAGDADLDGNPRIQGGTVDIGAYEYQTPVSEISYAWLQKYGLPITTDTDTANPDGDGLNNYQEWIAGTNPTNALSVLAMLSPVPTNNPAGLVVSWESVSNRTYFLQSGTNLASQPAFSTIVNNIFARAGTTSYTDTSATNVGPYFYRVGVQQ